MPRFGGSPVDPEIAAHVAEAARNLEALGHMVEEGEAPFDLAALDRIWSVVGPARPRLVPARSSGPGELVQAPLRRVAEQGAALQAADYVDALEKVTQMRAQLAETFTRSISILTPCFRGAAVGRR